MTTFEQLFSSSLYQAQPQTGDAGWCGYVLNPAGKAQPPASGVSLQTLFSTKNYYPYGIFLFSAAAPAVVDTRSAGAFADQVVDYLAKKYGSSGPFSNYALVWLADTAQLNDSTVTVITLSLSTFFSVVQPLSYNPSQNLELSIPASSPCALNGDLFNFFNTDPNQPTLSMNSQFGALYRNPVQNIYVPVSGPLTGCLVFPLQVTSVDYNFPATNATLRYFYGSPNNPAVSFNYPLFDSGQSQHALAYYMSLDPNDPLNANARLRTFMVPMTDPTTPTILPSAFSTDSGRQLGLSSALSFDDYPNTSVIRMPVTTTGMFVYVDNQGPGSRGNAYDLVPQGQFSMQLWNVPAPPDGTVLKLLGGLSGIETFSFRPASGSYTGDVLTFSPGSNAYAPAYVPPSGGATQSGAAQLTNAYTTAWIGISNGAGVTTGNVYHSQPTGASLYAGGCGVNTAAPSLLGFYEPVAATLEYGSPVVPVPMVPYGLLPATINARDASDFELKVLSTNRKAALEPTVQATAGKRTAAGNNPLHGDLSSGATIASTSPQGFVVQVDTTTNQWVQLALASNTTGGGTPVVMQFSNLTPALQSAFQTNQQFLVISWNKPITPGGTDYVLYGADGDAGNFQKEMQIDGWNFVADVPTRDPHGVFTNVLIFKFCEGALLDRVGDTSTWTSPGLFNNTENNNLSRLQTWVTDYCNTAISKYQGGDMNYGSFAAKVQQPDWNGILLLACDLDVNNFPPELQGLLAGINQAGFYGHHFGINVNHVSVDGNNTLQMKPVSSLFGLINYTDPVFGAYNENTAEYLANAPVAAGDYNYSVLSLKVLFNNSVIQNFSSLVKLSINSLFGCKVKAVSNTNVVIFKGAYENQNGTPNYTFNETSDNLLPLESNVLNGVEIVKASFVTVQPQGANGSTMVQVLFSFWGFLNFAQQSFDLFSFGSAQRNGENQFISGDGLAYANLTIAMRFALETSTVQLFTFDVSQMAFDLGQSNWREDGLYGHFPLQPTGILTGDGDKQPSAQGYLPLPVPGVAGSNPSGTWYGLVFNLNLGTMGDLTNALGFSSTLLLVWTTGANAQTGAMLHLPGMSPQAKTLSLQGVLKLDIGNMQLQAAQNQQGGNPVAYLLSLNQITLKFLSLSFPPSGAVDFYLFGNPDANAQPSSLGWYLGYQAPS